MATIQDRSVDLTEKLRKEHPDWNWDYWEAQFEEKCVICQKLHPFCMKTPKGAACPECVAVFVNDVLIMRSPFDRTLWKSEKNDCEQ